MKNKKSLLIIVLVIFGALIIYALLTRKQGDIVIDKKELTPVNDYNEFMAVNNVINEYLLNISLDNQDFIKDVTGSEVLITNSKEKDNYYSEKMFYIELDYNIYYYVSGRKMIYDYDTGKVSELKNDCYFVNVYKPNNTFKITKINDYLTYYNENDLYDRVIIKHNDYNDFKTYDIKYADEIIYSNYINYFKDLLFVNYSDAYNMLDSSYQSKIGSLDMFNSERETLYNNLNTIVEYHSISGDKGNRTYVLILSNGTKISVIENGIMNVKYKIEN